MLLMADSHNGYRACCYQGGGSLLLSACARAPPTPTRCPHRSLPAVRNGYNWQGGFAYLPGNGGTLAAVAMMAGGSDTSPPCNFPKSWRAICEDFLMAYP